MTDHAPDRLSALDAAFLHIERDGLPIHIGSVATFEGGPLLDERGKLRLDDLRAQVVSRLDALPRLRRRATRPPLGLGRPCWVDDPDFDVANHVDVIDLPGGDLEALRCYAEGLTAARLPADRPLWSLRFVTGLTEGRVGLIERAHHALVDGVSGVDVATVLLDLTPEVHPPVPSMWRPTPAPSPVALAVSGLAAQVTAPVRAARSVLGALGHPVHLACRAVEAADAVRTLAEDGPVAPRSSLNQPIGPARRLAWISTRLDDVKQAGRTHRATTNDVVLASVAHGLRGLLLSRGEILDGDDVLKVLIPVSLRDAAHRGALGNQVSALVLRLPIGIGDPVERLEAVARATRRLKHRREASTAQVLLGAADLLPAPLVPPIARLTETQRMVNVVVTNVPGPPVPLYCLGARMLEAFPVVPLGGNLSLSIAILSYDGALTIGITADPDLVPDLEVLTRDIEAGLVAVGAAWHPLVPRVGATARTA